MTTVILPIPLPLGQTRKIKTGRIVYEHCRDLLGNWDELRVLRDVYYECAKCHGRIDETEKQRLNMQAAGRDALHGWLPTKIGTPGIVSQHMSDLYSTDEDSSWGQIILELITAKKQGRRELQGVVNNRFGNVWHEEINKTAPKDLRDNIAGREGDDCPPYKRGNIPFIPSIVVIGSDVGGNYARWVLIAAMENQTDAAVIDWGDEIDPGAIGEIMMNNTWPCPADGKPRRINAGFIDAKFRKSEVLRICWHLYTQGLQLVPCTGTGGYAARGVRLWSYNPVNSFAYAKAGLRKLDFIDRDAKNDLYIGCINKRQNRLFFPVELGDLPPAAEVQQFITELCAEQLIEDKNGRKQWQDPPKGPNHFGDALKNAVTGLRFLSRLHHNVRENPES